jgi:hypothetical protein
MNFHNNPSTGSKVIVGGGGGEAQRHDNTI